MFLVSKCKCCDLMSMSVFCVIVGCLWSACVSWVCGLWVVFLSVGCVCVCLWAVFAGSAGRCRYDRCGYDTYISAACHVTGKPSAAVATGLLIGDILKHLKY